MKIHISKTIVAIIGLLSAGTIANAQAGAESLVLPKASGQNFYAEAGIGYIKDSIKNEDGYKFPSGLNNFYGISAAFGWRFAKEQKAQLEIGYYASSAKDSGDTIKGTAIPVLASYSYCFELGQARNDEIRVTPTAGIYSLKLKETGDSVSGTPFAFGVGAGYTHHFSKLLYLDAGYRLLNRGAVKDSGYTVAKSTIMHCLNVSVGFKF